jgi:hypothetical protein
MDELDNRWLSFDLDYHLERLEKIKIKLKQSYKQSKNPDLERLTRNISLGNIYLKSLTKLINQIRKEYLYDFNYFSKGAKVGFSKKLTKTHLFNLELKAEEYLEIRRMVIEKFGSIEQSQMVIFDLQEYLFDY